MIKEVAIEPEVMATWAHFRELWDDCGVGRGRLIAEFPPDWREVVCRRAYEISSAKAASISARLKPPPGHAASKKWIPSRRAYEKGKDWLTNAEKHEPPNGFDVVVARRNPREKSRVVVAGEFAKDRPPWKTATQVKVARVAVALVQCAAVLLAASDEIMLVDPNFDATEPRFKDPLMAVLGTRDSARPWKRCEFHTERPADSSVLANRISNCRRHLPEVVPSGNTLRVHFWSRKATGEKLHPRFLLTELGGIQFDYGLDQGQEGETTIATLLDESLWRQLLSDYSLAGGTFEIDQSGIIAIRGQA